MRVGEVSGIDRDALAGDRIGRPSACSAARRSTAPVCSRACSAWRSNCPGRSGIRATSIAAMLRSGGPALVRGGGHVHRLEAAAGQPRRGAQGQNALQQSTTGPGLVHHFTTKLTIRFGTWMRLTMRLPSSRPGDIRFGFRGGDHRVGRRIGRHLDGAAQLAHHLHRDGHGVGDQQRRGRPPAREAAPPAGRRRDAAGRTPPRPDAASSARSAERASPGLPGAPRPGRVPPRPVRPRRARWRTRTAGRRRR